MTSNSDLQKYYSTQLTDALLALPGVECKNVHKLMNKYKNLAEICTRSEMELSGVLGNPLNAKKLYDFLHTKQARPETGPKKKAKVGAYHAYKNAKKK